MQLYYVVALCVIAVSAVMIVAVRMHFKKENIDLSDKIKHIPTYKENIESESEHTQEEIYKRKSTEFIDIPTEIKNVFGGVIVSSTEKANFVNHFAQYFQEAISLIKKLEALNIVPTDIIMKFVIDYENIEALIKQHNDDVINHLLTIYKDFFDHCLKYPLDKQQRRSIVSEEDNCLVISSAGSGKTSSIVGKVKYLIEVKGVSPEKILLISYTNKAAAELTERMNVEGLKGYTFHKLAIDIIGKSTGIKPSICSNTDVLLMEIYRKMLDDKNFKKDVLECFVDYGIYETWWEKRESERREQLSEQKNAQFKALFPDMDGKSFYVRSEQEQKICFVLSSLSVRFRYEEPYEHQLADENHSQYCPDFSIYYECGGVTQRIYLEHFGVDEHGLVPIWFAKEKNISYEEANKKYNDGITWKRAAHHKFGTKLLVTTSADFHYLEIKDKLKELLSEAGVPFKEKSDEDLYDAVLPKKSKQEKSFVRLVTTFVTLIKSSCKSINDVLVQAKRKGDDQSAFIIEKIFLPMYKCYEKTLADSGRIDFTDIILQATEICRNLRPVEYDYIIVDEFQDISVDRYNFLKVLRNGSHPAKLYCVGDDWQSIYRFSGSDMALFNQFPKYFGATEINKIETTYRFGEPLVSKSSLFIQRNSTQIKKNIHSSMFEMKTELEFCPYDKRKYCDIIERRISSIPSDKSLFLLGRYSFDDYYLSYRYKCERDRDRCYYMICGRKVEFLTVHKSKGLEADYVIILQCNKGTYGFPSLVSDASVLNYVLTESDKFPYGEERRLFYVAITRAKVKTIVLYEERNPSVFVDEFLHPEKITKGSYVKHHNANKRWTRGEDSFLLKLYSEGKSLKYIAEKMGRSQTSIVMRLNKLNQ